LSNKLNGNLVSDEKNIIGVNSNTIKLNYGYFAVDALVFKNLKSRKAVLTNGKRKITLEYSGFPYFLIWTKPNAPYICLEPWKGIPDSENATGNLIDKEGIISIKKDENSVSYHCITFEL